MSVDEFVGVPYWSLDDSKAAALLLLMPGVQGGGGEGLVMQLSKSTRPLFPEVLSASTLLGRHL